jgi:hypothetical protein
MPDPKYKPDDIVMAKYKSEHCGSFVVYTGIMKIVFSKLKFGKWFHYFYCASDDRVHCFTEESVIAKLN